MGIRAFDRKFGKEFITSLPTSPAVYFVYDGAGRLIYIGKAKNLRRRLSQYRNAKRRKKHLKMKSIVADAARIEYRLCASDLEACLLENRLIQEHRPRWNIEGAYFFLYPLLGLSKDGDHAAFCYTTQPEAFPGFRFHGAYRSRFLTREAFFALIELLDFVGHRAKGAGRRSPAVPKHSYVYRFRQLPEAWLEQWSRFLSGESAEAAETLVLTLVENAGARRDPDRIQKSLDSIRRFWRHEALPLRRAIEISAYPHFPVPQRERDLLFIKRRAELRNTVAARPGRG